MTSTKSILKLFFSFLLCLMVSYAKAQITDSTKLNTDSITSKKTNNNKFKPNYFLIGGDILKPISYTWEGSKLATEFFATAPYKNSELVAELGYANAKFDTKFLDYTSNSSFLKIGVNKFLFDKAYDEDEDEIFSGIRYGISYINRGDANYTITDIWGTNTGIIKSSNHLAHWGEIILGLRMQVYKNVFLGWMIRGKFLINGKAFIELPPSYISGYGVGYKPTVMDFGMQIAYKLHR